MERNPPDQSVGEDSLTCQEATALLTEYLAGALPVQTTQAFEAHLRLCSDCLAYCQTYRTTVRLTRTLRYAEIPAVLQERLLSFLQARSIGASVCPPREKDEWDP